MRAPLVFFSLCISSLASAAPKRVGVLVLGDYLKGPTAQETERWLRDHNQQPVANPLPPDAVKSLENCFVIDDPKCSRGIVDARSNTDGMISIRVDIASKKERDIRLTIDWFVKGHAPITARRNCEDCSENVLRTTLDAMLMDLAKTSPGFMGRVKVVSDMPGIPVLLDKETIGVTPIERDVPAGPHKARLVKDGRMGEEKPINVEAGATAEVKLMPPPPQSDQPPPQVIMQDRPSRVFPTICIVTGVLAIVGGSVMVWKGGPTGERLDMKYDDFRTPGYVVGGAGVALIATGVIWIVATRHSSGPTVAVTPHGDATIGWTGRF